MLRKVMTVAAAVAIGAALPAAAQDKGKDGYMKLKDVGSEGRSVTVDGKKLSVSGSRTKITIGGKEATRDKLKNDLECKVEAKGDEASRIDCK